MMMEVDDNEDGLLLDTDDVSRVSAACYAAAGDHEAALQRGDSYLCAFAESFGASQGRDRELIGFSQYVVSPESISVVRLCVLPQYRRQGVGSWLMRKIIGRCRQKLLLVRHPAGNGSRLFLDTFDFRLCGSAMLDGQPVMVRMVEVL